MVYIDVFLVPDIYIYAACPQSDPVQNKTKSGSYMIKYTVYAYFQLTLNILDY